MTEYLTLPEAAKQLNLDRDTIRKWAKNDKIPGAYQINPKGNPKAPWLIPAAWVEAVKNERGE